MRIAVTGATGLIGQALCTHLRERGHDVVTLVRNRASLTGSSIYWSPVEAIVDVAALEGVQAVVHLAGAPIGSARWNDKVKARILNSRVQGTDVLARALAAMQQPPAVLVSGSAVGVYGDRGDEVLTEDAAPGDNFLSKVCVAWEQAADPARAAGIRVVHPRTGIVLTESGGALGKMVVPFRLGVGGRIGDGRQFMSWISLNDEVRALTHLVESELEGPVNLTGPMPVDNATFTRALGQAVHRPTVLPVPAGAIRLVLGEMGQRLLLDSQRAVPSRLLEDGFVFDHPDVDAGLEWAIGH